MKTSLLWLVALVACSVSAADAPKSTNEISWSGIATNAQGKTVARIVVDTSEVPDLAAWGKHAGELCAEWYPKIAVLLGVDSFLTNRTVRLWFQKDMRGVANSNPRSGVINVSANYVKGHTNDWGMIVHELVHTVQSFGGRGSAPAPTFSAEDIKDLPSLAARLKEQADPVSKFLWGEFSDVTHKAVLAFAGTDAGSNTLQTALARELNEIVRTNAIYEESRFASVTLSEQAKSQIGRDLQGSRLTRFNRSLLEDAYPKEIAKNRSGRGGSGGSWLTEGIADYIRLVHFEPEARRPRINPDRAKYTDSYKTTAGFLEWIEKRYDKQFVRKINLALRNGKYKVELFKDYTGKTIDELWTEFADALRKKV